MNKLFLLLGILSIIVLSFVTAAPQVQSYIKDDLGLRNGTIFLNVTYNYSGLYNFPTGGYISLGNPIAYFNDSINYTISLWARSSTDAGAPTIFSYRNTSSSTPILFQIDRSTATNIRVLVRNDSNTATTLTATGVSSNNTWIHITLTKSANNLTLYINGTSFASLNAFGSIGVDAMIIGGGVAGTPTVQASSFWGGDIDEIRVYNASLNNTQVTQLFNQGMVFNSSLLSSNLLNYYSFSDTGFILVNGTGDANFTYINNSIFDKTKINNTGLNQYLLGAGLIINSASVNLTSLNENVRIASNPTYQAYLNILTGNTFFNNSNFSSWNNNTNSIDASYINKTLTLRPRAFVRVTHGLCNLFNNSFSGFGYSDGLTSTSKMLEGVVLDTCDNSTVHSNNFYNNHFLFSAYNSDNLLFFNNTGTNTTGGNLSLAVTGFGFYSLTNSKVFNNTVSEVRSLTGWKLDDSQAMSLKGIGVNNTMFNNYVTNAEAGLVIFNQHDNSSLINNTVLNIDGSGLKIEDGGINTRTLRNIIVRGNTVINAGKNTSVSTVPRFGIELDFLSGAANNSNFIVDQNRISDSYNCINTKYGQDIVLSNNNCVNLSTTSFVTNLDGAFSIENTTNITIINNSFGSTATLYQLALIDSNISIYSIPTSLETINTGVTKAKQSLYNLSNALLFNSNGSLYGSSDISLNDGSLNITLNPNNISYVLQDYTLTEGANRAFNPVWFSSSSATQKTITSNVSQTINTTLILIVSDCGDVGSVQLDSVIVQYTCESDVLTINQAQIDSGDNIVEIFASSGINTFCGTEGYSFFHSALGKVVIFIGGAFMSLIVLVVIMFLLMFAFAKFEGTPPPPLPILPENNKIVMAVFMAFAVIFVVWLLLVLFGMICTL